MTDRNPHDTNEFLREAQTERTGLITEFIDFLKHNKKWWLIPILLALVAIALVVMLALVGGGAAAPFIYTLF